MSELKKCRTCGSENVRGRIMFGKTTEPLSKCDDCGHIEPTRTWNNRPLEDSLRRENERLATQLKAAEAEINHLASHDPHNEVTRLRAVVAVVEGYFDKQMLVDDIPSMCNAMSWFSPGHDKYPEVVPVTCYIVSREGGSDG